MKKFQKNLNTLRWDMVTVFYHFNVITNRRAVSLRLFVFYLSHGLVWVREINRIHHSCVDVYSYSCLHPLSNERKSMFKSGDSRAV